MKSTCKKCNAVDEKFLKHVYPDGSQYYVNASGKAWGGMLCPKCYRDYKVQYKKKHGGQTLADKPHGDCKQCGKRYKRKNVQSEYCSQTCRSRSYYIRKARPARTARQEQARADKEPTTTE